MFVFGQWPLNVCFCPQNRQDKGLFHQENFDKSFDHEDGRVRGRGGSCGEGGSGSRFE